MKKGGFYGSQWADSEICMNEQKAENSQDTFETE